MVKGTRELWLKWRAIMGNRKAERPPKKKRKPQSSNPFGHKPNKAMGNWDYPNIENIEQLLDYLGHDQKRIRNFMSLSVYKESLERRPWLRELEKYA